MADAILVLNAGSSSIKFSVFGVDGGQPALLIHGQVEGISTAPHFIATDAHGKRIGERRWEAVDQFDYPDAIQYLGQFLRSHDDGHHLLAIGHRVVHGGTLYSGATLITPEVIDKLEQLVPLAPLHQPHNLASIRILAQSHPEVAQVACFDTAFHRAQLEVAQAFALPAEITGRGVRRYGFHGLSYEYIASVLPTRAPQAAQGRVVVAHLGNGVSMCAMRDGRSVASTMGFTAIDGLVMGTRSGNLDPGVILYLVDQMKMDARAIEDLLYRQSGLLGVSGISSDMRTLLASDDPHARFAVELFTYRIGRELGSLCSALGGIDALVFTAGIGEHAPQIRERVCRDASWLGIDLDEDANLAGSPCISMPSSKVTAWVIPTDEEAMIARHALAAIRAASA